MSHLGQFRINPTDNEYPPRSDDHSNWRIKSNRYRPKKNVSQMNHNDDSKDFGEKDDDKQPEQTQAFVPNNPNTNHRYNRQRYNKYNTHSGYNNHRPSHNRMRNPRKQQQLLIESDWKRIIYDPHNKKLKNTIAEIIKYGQRCRDNCTFTDYLIFYGRRVLHTNIYGDVIGLYNGGWQGWEKWFWYFMSGNMIYPLHIFNRIDLFGLSTICGRDLTKDTQLGYAITLSICKNGWVEGLRYIVETLNINHINNEFQVLVEAAYRSNADILRYLLISHTFYEYFDINDKKNKYDETLWSCCVNQFKNIIKPGFGWLHCLECLHYAPYLIYEIHGYMHEGYDDEKDNDKDDDDNDDDDNWMMDEVDELDLNIETIEIPQQFINERLDIIYDLRRNKPVTCKLESCYYGLCLDAGYNKPHCIHFWKPHIKRTGIDGHFFEYIPQPRDHVYDEDSDEAMCWGRIRMSVSDELWLTALSSTNMVKLCPIMKDDAQLWRIKQIELENVANIWIQIINKLGFKLIFSWKSRTHLSEYGMPILSISNKVNEIDALCIDLFSVAKTNRSTRYYLYAEKYGGDNAKDILSRIGGTLNRNSFWRMVDGSRFYPTKYECYKRRVTDIAKILWQFQQGYIESCAMLDEAKSVIKCANI